MSIRPLRTPTSSAPSGRRLAGVGVLGLLAVAALVLSACSSTNSASSTTTSANTGAVSLKSLQRWPTSNVALTQTGSTLLYPLFNLWVAQIEHQWPNVSITTAATGSGTGVSAASNGTVNIGASDAYLSPAQRQANTNLENIPLAISGQMVNYNLPGISGHLKLSGSVLSAIYQGQITKWNDSKIASLNPGVSLPDMAIVPLHRSDSSGDTFLFSSFLSASDPSGWTLPPGTTVSWPSVSGQVAAQGNGGMVTACKANPGCVAYIGISYQNQATAAGLGYAALQNKSGNYELPTQATFSAAASEFASKTPSNGTQSMIYGSAANGYPIINYEYAIVSTKQSSSTVAQTVKAVLAWAVDPDNGSAPSFLDQVGFIALPVQVQLISANLISKVG